MYPVTTLMHTQRSCAVSEKDRSEQTVSHQTQKEKEKKLSCELEVKADSEDRKDNKRFKRACRKIAQEKYQEARRLADTMKNLEKSALIKKLSYSVQSSGDVGHLFEGVWWYRVFPEALRLTRVISDEEKRHFVQDQLSIQQGDLLVEDIRECLDDDDFSRAYRLAQQIAAPGRRGEILAGIQIQELLRVKA